MGAEVAPEWRSDRGRHSKSVSDTIANPNPPHWYRRKNPRGRWDVFDGKGKLVKADLTRREAASLIGEQWDAKGRTVGWL